jgi:hypothetical protein
VKADYRAIGKFKPSRFDKISFGQRSLRGNGCPPERSCPPDSIDSIVRGLRCGPHTCGLRYWPLAIQLQSRADMVTARLPVVIGVAVNNKAARDEANG